MAREKKLPEIARLLSNPELGWANITKAYHLAVEAERAIPHDPAVRKAIADTSKEVAITTSPAGAAVYMREVSAPEDQWSYPGRTPIVKVRVPAGYVWWKLEKEGYEAVMAAAPKGRQDVVVGTGHGGVRGSDRPVLERDS